MISVEVKRVSEVRTELSDKNRIKLIAELENSKKNCLNFNYLVGLRREAKIFVESKRKIKTDYNRCLTLLIKLLDIEEILEFRSNALSEIEKVKSDQSDNKRSVAKCYKKQVEEISSYFIVRDIMDSKKALFRFNNGFEGGNLLDPLVEDGGAFRKLILALYEIDPKILNKGIITETIMANKFSALKMLDVLNKNNLTEDSNVTVLIFLLSFLYQARKNLFEPILDTIDGFSNGRLHLKDNTLENKKKLLENLLLGDSCVDVNKSGYKYYFGSEYYRGIVARLERNINDIVQHYGSDSEMFLRALTNVGFLRTSNVKYKQKAMDLWDLLIEPISRGNFAESIDRAEKLFKQNPELAPLSTSYEKMREYELEKEKYELEKERIDKLIKIRREKDALIYVADREYNEIPFEIRKYLGLLLRTSDGFYQYILPSNGELRSGIKIIRLNNSGMIINGKRHSYDSEKIKDFIELSKQPGSRLIPFYYTEDGRVWKVSEKFEGFV